MSEETKDQQPSLISGAGTEIVKPTLSQVEQEKIERQNKIKYAIERLTEMKKLFNYLEKAHGKNRFTRKQFRRDLVSTERFADSMIDNVIKFYEVGGNTETIWEGKS